MTPSDYFGAKNKFKAASLPKEQVQAHQPPSTSHKASAQ